jgi:hypothetical protein
MFSAPRMARDVTRFYGDLSQGRVQQPSFIHPVKVSETTAV